MVACGTTPGTTPDPAVGHPSQRRRATTGKLAEAPCAEKRGRRRGKSHHEPPAAVEQREEIGQWEMGTIVGSAGHRCVVTLVERVTGCTRPVVCMDETNKQLVGETRVPIAAGRGRPRRIDYEYERRGTADVFLFTEPLGNWRCVGSPRAGRAATGRSM